MSERRRPGERLPSERELSDVLQVNRSSVREALKRLEQVKLIEIRHGEGSVVLNFRETGGFELLGDLLGPVERPNPLAIRSILEFRALIVPEIARLAAMRIGAEQLAVIDDIVARIDGLDDDQVHQLQELDFDLHYAMARASENLALLLILNSVRDIYFRWREAFAAMFAPTLSTDLYRKLASALRDRDSVRAMEVCRSLTLSSNERLREFYDDAGRSS